MHLLGTSIVRVGVSCLYLKFKCTKQWNIFQLSLLQLEDGEYVMCENDWTFGSHLRNMSACGKPAFAVILCLKVPSPQSNPHYASSSFTKQAKPTAVRTLQLRFQHHDHHLPTDSGNRSTLGCAISKDNVHHLHFIWFQEQLYRHGLQCCSHCSR